MKVGIIGGGVAGLAAAYRLLQAGHQIQLFEAGPSLGGLVRNFTVGGSPIECFYHHIFSTDTNIVSLIKELGLEQELVWRESKVGLYYNSRIYDFVTPLDLLRFDAVPLVDRVRLGLMGLYLRRQKDRRRFEDITAKDWLTRFVGRGNYEVVWGPLLRGKFGELEDEVVMSWLWNKIHLRFSSRRAGPIQKEVLGYMVGSFGLYISELVDRIRKLGGVLMTSRPVERVIVEGGHATGFAVQQPAENIEFDSIIATIGNGLFFKLCPSLPEYYVDKLRSVEYEDALCLVLTLKRPFSRVYWLNVNDRSFPFLALIEHTNLIDASHYGGEHILYVSNYLAKSSPLFDLDVNGIFDLYFPYLARINPSFSEEWVSERRLFRGVDAQPIFTVDSVRSIPEHATPIRDLYLANMSQIYPEDRGQNYSIRLGEQVADIVIKSGQDPPG